MIENIIELRDGLTIEEIKIKWPWLLKGKFENAILGKGGFYNSGDVLVWYGGNWIDGIWEGVDVIKKVISNWKSGCFLGGTWKNGHFYNGLFGKATWESGIFYGGIWRGGDWIYGGYSSSGSSLLWESGRVLMDGEFYESKKVGPRILTLRPSNVKLIDGLTLEILEKSPQHRWIFHVEIKNATIGIRNNKLVFYSGTWLGGHFIGGIWEGGIFKSGWWRYGTWINGYWLSPFQTLDEIKLLQEEK